MFCEGPAISLLLLHCPVFLSFFGIASIGLSCLVALFLYHVVFGIQYLGILNGVAAFVIVGIGEFSQPRHRTPASPRRYPGW